MKKTMVALVLLLLPSISTFAQDATVTFYSPRYTRKTALKVLTSFKGEMPFSGWVFDGNHKMAELLPNHFMTVHLPVGDYEFSASERSKHPASNALLPLTLQAGDHYFIRIASHYVNFEEIAFLRGTFEEVSCDVAHREIPKAKPIKVKHVQHDYLNDLDSAASLPDCK